MNKRAIHKKEKEKKSKETSLVDIARLMLVEPVLALDSKAFIKKVANILDISKQQAKKNVQELLKKDALLADVDYKKELAKKIKELAFIKEASLQSNNINAYLGAVKLESAILGLEKLNIFKVEKDDEYVDLEEKKELIIKEYFSKKENN